MHRVLVVDDDMRMRESIIEVLKDNDYLVEEASDGLDCIAKVKKGTYDVILLDVKMDKMDGMETLDRLKAINVNQSVVMMSAHGTIETALEAVHRGAHHFFEKPFDINTLLINVRNAIESQALKQQNETLVKEVNRINTRPFIGRSPAFLEMKDMIERMAKHDVRRVLILGENGTGKELVARQIHALSRRSDKVLAEVNCAAIPSHLMESDLFGHMKGSFTDAKSDHPGKFEQANGGVLFLDEIGDMDLAAQAKILRALEENKIRRIGGTRDIPVDVMVLAATNKNVRKMVDNGAFRMDLLQRLAIAVVNVPSLEERKEDIPLLVDHFNEHVAREQRVSKLKFNDDAMDAMVKMKYPGNIRQLRNTIERLFIFSDGVISADDVHKHSFTNDLMFR